MLSFPKRRTPQKSIPQKSIISTSISGAGYTEKRTQMHTSIEEDEKSDIVQRVPPKDNGAVKGKL